MLLHYPIVKENGINRKNTVLLKREMGIPFKSRSSSSIQSLFSPVSAITIIDLDVTIVTSLTPFPSTHRHKSLTSVLGRETSFMNGPKTLSLVAVSANEVSKSVL